MRTNKLQFSQLQQEFAVLEKKDLKRVVGGLIAINKKGILIFQDFIDHY